MFKDPQLFAAVAIMRRLQRELRTLDRGNSEWLSRRRSRREELRQIERRVDDLLLEIDPRVFDR